jgi:hypothetical protein
MTMKYFELVKIYVNNGACPPGGMATTSAMTSNPDQAMGEEYWKTVLDMADARNLHPVADRSLPEAVAATWKVHRLREILPTASWVPDYSEIPVIQQRLRHI